MSPQTIDSRMDNLEGRVTELEKLPERIAAVETQIVQLRIEMRGEFSAVREEIRAGDAETRRVLGEQLSETRRYLDEQIADTRQQATEQVEETRRYMRVLHEEVIGRMATFQEGRPARRPTDADRPPRIRGRKKR